MATTYSTRRGPAFPLAVGSRGYVGFAEGSALTKQAILQVLATARGSRVMRPEFGSRLHELVYSPCDAATGELACADARDALGEIDWIRVLSVEATLDEDNGKVSIRIAWQEIDTGVRDDLDYPMPVQRAA